MDDFNIIAPADLEFRKGFGSTWLTFVKDATLMEMLSQKFDSWDKQSKLLSADCMYCEIRTNLGIRGGVADIEANKKDIKYMSAETRAFKRACASWGLGKYLYRLGTNAVTLPYEYPKELEQELAYLKLVEYLWSIDEKAIHIELEAARDWYLDHDFTKYCLKLLNKQGYTSYPPYKTLVKLIKEKMDKDKQEEENG